MLKIDRSFHAAVEAMFCEMSWDKWKQQYPENVLTVKVVVEEQENEIEGEPNEFLLSEVAGIQLTIDGETHTYYLPRSEVHHIPYLNYQDESERPTEAIELKEPIIKRVCGYRAG
jgi:hypothetical protein